ncbi:hypothetical protein [Streptomyces sp. AC550_RSS872]|uniref:hypothetical protein n=1 Tax=Streptomyces sp. AC550_RSS872 TaxID=2823689 RepID=UPI0035ABEBCE
MLHAAHGRSNACIARDAGMRLDTVCGWRVQFARAGPPGLRDRQRCGGPSSFTPLQATEEAGVGGRARRCRSGRRGRWRWCAVCVHPGRDAEAVVLLEDYWPAEPVFDGCLDSVAARATARHPAFQAGVPVA